MRLSVSFSSFTNLVPSLAVACPLLRIGVAVLTATLAGCLNLAFGQQPTDNASAPITVAESKSTAPVMPSSVDEQYLIGPGDGLRIEVFNKPQLTREETVDIRGMIRMPLIEEDIRASCRTERELAAEIARMYRDRQLLKNPLVSVAVKDFQSQPVAVIGSVNSPGRFVLRRRVSLLELLVFHAGGPTAKAGRKVQILSTAASSCRSHDSVESGDATSAEGSIVTYDLQELVQGNEAMNPFVRQGDIINVPAADEVIIVGNVLRPAAVPIVEPTTLARAIAMVGGTLPNSKKDKIRVTRQTPGSAATTEFLVDMKATDKAKGEGFLLQGGDIVEVSTNTGLRNILRSLSTAIVPMATNLPIRVIP